MENKKLKIESDFMDEIVKLEFNTTGNNTHIEGYAFGTFIYSNVSAAFLYNMEQALKDARRRKEDE
jgi:hypothetical protein